MQENVKNKLEKTNAKYKMEANKHRWFKSFDVGDEVMVFISKVRMQGGHRKFQQRKYEPYQIVKKINKILMWLTCQLG